MKKELEFSHPFWGLSDDGCMPKKSVLFSEGNHDPIEDFFQHNAIFINGRGQTCHSDSYGTIVDFSALEKSLTLLNEEFSPTKEDWIFHLSYWLGNPNMQPPLRLVALTIARKFGVDVAPFEKERLSDKWQ